jgi:hypothetical protein
MGTIKLLYCAFCENEIEEAVVSYKDKSFCCDECISDYKDAEYEAACEARANAWEDGDCDFADPGGRSALRAETDDNPRNLPCPNCGVANRLTPADRARGYQCDSCADRAEGRYVGGDY